MVTVSVEMRAFMGGVIRPVDVPDGELELTLDVLEALDVIYRYGQNDVQPKPFCSVSVGDVILYQGRRYQVAPTGFTEVL